MNIPCRGILAEDVRDLFPEFLQGSGIGTYDPELQWIGYGRTQRRSIGARANAGVIVLKVLPQARHQAITARHVGRQNDQLCEIRPVELLVKRDVIPRRAVADIGDVVPHVRVSSEERFNALSLGFGRTQTRPLGQPKFDQ